MLDKIKEVRNRSNVSLGLCKKAVEESNGDVEEALLLLRKWGAVKATKLAKNEAREGKIFSYTHHDGKKACLVEINCQTDFGANSDVFNEFGEQVMLQIISMSPSYLTSSDVPESELQKQRGVFNAQMENISEEKRPHVVNGKIKKWFSDVCLVDQKSVVISGKTIEQLREELVQKISENVIIKRFVHWEIT